MTGKGYTVPVSTAAADEEGEQHPDE